ncbi:MAG: hypothetical protein AB8B63_16145 [Granulosicoccus sp.]
MPKHSWKSPVRKFVAVSRRTSTSHRTTPSNLSRTSLATLAIVVAMGISACQSLPSNSPDRSNLKHSSTGTAELSSHRQSDEIANEDFSDSAGNSQAKSELSGVKRSDYEPVVPPATVVPRDTSASEPTPDNWQHQIQSQFIHAKALVESELNTDLANIKLMLVNDAPINQEVQIETQRLVKNQFDSPAFADRFLEQVMQSQAGTYAALFSARLGAVMVSRQMLETFESRLPADANIRRAALLTLLIHELVHAADDKRYQIHAKRALSFRASFAQSATFEGHAQWVTRNICQRAGCLSGLDALDDFMFSTQNVSNQLTQPVEAISRNVLEYSYVEGERFIVELAKRENGATLIDSILTSPPHDPVQILAPHSYPDTDRDRRNDHLIKATTSIEHPWITHPWAAVETSPLKGINLRSEPLRRQSAIDGFTRLIRAMVAMQLYDQRDIGASPVEVTLLQAESAQTARLFGSTLYRNTHQADAVFKQQELKISPDGMAASPPVDMQLYRTEVQAGTLPFHTAIGVSGSYVIQIAGSMKDTELMENFVIRVLMALQTGQDLIALQSVR